MVTNSPRPDMHYKPRDVRDRIAFAFVNVLRFFADSFFAKR